MTLLITITNSSLLLFNNINWLLYKFYSLIIKVYTTAQGHTTTFMNSKRLDWNNHMPVLPFQLFINHPPFFLSVSLSKWSSGSILSQQLWLWPQLLQPWLLQNSTTDTKETGWRDLWCTMGIEESVDKGGGTIQIGLDFYPNPIIIIWLISIIRNFYSQCIMLDTILHTINIVFHLLLQFNCLIQLSLNSFIF